MGSAHEDHLLAHVHLEQLETTVMGVEHACSRRMGNSNTQH
jgi:hypothetical protein